MEGDRSAFAVAWDKHSADSLFDMAAFAGAQKT
jgi:hypothetical protein